MIAAVSNTDNEVLIDVGEATKHLRLLGYTDHCPVVLCAYGKTNLAIWYKNWLALSVCFSSRLLTNFASL